ncbi:MAG: right-handed parallel beta-helix repeat-containing protein [Planctomycetota bacterium]
MIRKCICLVVLFCGGVIRAETIEIGPNENWFEVLNGSDLRPGTRVELRSGIYSDPRRLSIGHAGTADEAIVIRAKPGHQVLLRRPDNRQNTVNLEGAQYLSIEGIEITGGAAAIRIQRGHNRMPRNVSLIGLHIHHIGGVAVTCNEPGTTYREMLFRGNHIHHTSGHGEGFYLGANNDREGKTTAVFRDSIVEQNHIHDLNDKTVSQGDGIEIKDGSFGNIIRDNRIHDTKYPGIIVYGTDGNAPNRIERNAIWNSGDHGIQAASDAIIQNNIVFNVRNDGIRSREHQSARVGGLRIVNNTIVNLKGTGIRIDAIDFASERVLIANNAVFATTPLRAPSKTDKIRSLGNEFSTRAPSTLREFYPVADSSLIGGANSELQPTDDFDGEPREGSSDIGAYRFSPHGPKARYDAYSFEVDRK